MVRVSIHQWTKKVNSSEKADRTWSVRDRESGGRGRTVLNQKKTHRTPTNWRSTGLKGSGQRRGVAAGVAGGGGQMGNVFDGDVGPRWNFVEDIRKIGGKDAK